MLVKSFPSTIINDAVAYTYTTLFRVYNGGDAELEVNVSFICLKLFGSILYQILCALLNDGYDKYEHNNRHCSSFPGQLSHISM